MQQSILNLLNVYGLTAAPRFAVVLSILLISAGPSFAAKKDCANGQICAWKDANYRSCFDNDLRQQDRNWSNGEPRWDNCRWPNRMNDQVTSYWNRSGKWVIFYKHKDGGRPAHCVAPGAFSANVGKALNDSFSSHTVFSNKPSPKWCNTWDWK